MNYIKFLFTNLVINAAGTKAVNYSDYLENLSFRGMISVWLVSEVLLFIALLFIIAGRLGAKNKQSSLKFLGNAVRDITGRMSLLTRAILLTSVNFIGSFYLFKMTASSITFPIVIAISFQVIIGHLIILNTAERITTTVEM